jgi:predicted cobalt transporter CbtA
VPATPDEKPLVSRDGQRAGLFLATSLYGVALGGIFAVGFALFRRKLRTSSDSYAALGLAAAGYVGIVLVPFLKYPPNPPAVGDPETITRRTVTYLLTLVIGLLAVWAGVAASRWALRFGPAQWIRLAVGGSAFLATVVAAYLILPTINEVPGSFPATLLWQFRLASLGTQTTLWLLLGLGYAAVIDRRTPAPTQAAAVAA